MEKTINRNRQKVERKAKDTVHQLFRDIERCGRTACEDFESSLNILFPLTVDTVSEAFRKDLKSSLQTINAPISNAMDRWKKKGVEETVSELESLKDELHLDDDAFTTDFTVMQVDAYADERENAENLYKQKMQELQQMSQMNSDELEKLNIKKEDVEKSIAALDDAYNETKKAYDTEANDYTPKYIQRGGKLGPVFSKVGDAIDIAMLLIPGEGWAKAGTKLGAEAAKLAAKGGKLAEQGAKALGVMSKGANYMSKLDSSKDLATLAKRIEDNGIVKRGGNDVTALDMLSASYWMQQQAILSIQFMQMLISSTSSNIMTA